MVRRDPDPLPSAIPSPQAAPVSTYYDPRLPIPRIDPTLSELESLTTALTKFGLLKRKDEKEQAKVDATAAAWRVTDAELEEMIQKGLAPSTAQTGVVPDSGPEEVAAEAAARARIYDESTKDLRKTFLELREDGLPKNADPFYRKWYAKTMGERLASMYKNEVSSRLKETYELSADTGQPAADYSDLSHEIYEKYAPLREALGQHGEDAFDIIKGQADSALAEQARAALNEREDAQAQTEWTAGNVNYLVDAFLDGTFDAGEYTTLQQRYKDARFEVSDVRSHFVANLKTAANRFIQMEKEGQLEPGEGKQLALDLMQSLVPVGDDSKGVILGTSIKADEALKGEISAFRIKLEDDYERDEARADARLKKKLVDTVLPIADAVANAGGDQQAVAEAVRNELNKDGELSRMDFDVVNDVTWALRYSIDEDAKDGEWSDEKKTEVEAEYLEMKLGGAPVSELRAFLLESGATRNHTRWAASQEPGLNEMLSRRVQDNPEIGDAMRTMDQTEISEAGPAYRDSYNERRRAALDAINKSETPEEALEIAATAQQDLQALTDTENARLKGVRDTVRGFRNAFDSAGASSYLEENRDSLHPRTIEELETEISRFPSEATFEQQYRTELERDIIQAMESKPLYLEGKDSKLNAEAHLLKMRDANSRSAGLRAQIEQAWDESTGTPEQRRQAVSRKIKELVPQAFDGWYEDVQVQALDGQTETLVGAVEAGTSPAMVERWKFSKPNSVTQTTDEVLQSWQRTGRMPAPVNSRSPKTIRQRLQHADQYEPNGPAALTTAKADDLTSLQFFLKPLAPPEDQDILPEGLLSGKRGTQGGDPYASSESLTPAGRDAVVVTVARNRLIGVGDLLKGSFTVEADDPAPDFSKMQEYGRGQWPFYEQYGYYVSVPAERFLGTKQWRKVHYSFASIPGVAGIQKDYPVDIKPERLAAIGVTPFNYKENFLLQSSEDVALLHKLAKGEDLQSGEPVTEIDGQPLNEVRRSFLANFGITNETVTNPALNLSDDKLELWCEEIRRKQLSLGSRLQAFSAQQTEPEPQAPEPAPQEPAPAPAPPEPDAAPTTPDPEPPAAGPAGEGEQVAGEEAQVARARFIRDSILPDLQAAFEAIPNPNRRNSRVSRADRERRDRLAEQIKFYEAELAEIEGQ